MNPVVILALVLSEMAGQVAYVLWRDNRALRRDVAHAVTDAEMAEVQYDLMRAERDELQQRLVAERGHVFDLPAADEDAKAYLDRMAAYDKKPKP